MEQADIERLLLERDRARKRKEFAHADEIRAGLDAEGIVVEDTPFGTSWRRKGWPAYATLRAPIRYAEPPMTFLGRDLTELVRSIKFHDPCVKDGERGHD